MSNGLLPSTSMGKYFVAGRRWSRKRVLLLCLHRNKGLLKVPSERLR